jgi:microcystin-dependent protein
VPGLLSTVIRLSLLAAVVAVAAAPASPAHAERPLAGLPVGASLLFVLDADSGSLAPARRDRRAGDPRRRYTLTLTGLDRRVTWFADRPRREAGTISPRRMFASWKALGFRQSPPNAALVVHRADRKRDTMAVELRLRSFEPRRDRVRFAVTALAGFGNGLRQLAKRVDRRVARRFGGASLFVDNASIAGPCALGQPQLFATNHSIRGMLRADGRLLPIRDNEALYSIYGTEFGGNGTITFALPDLIAPLGMNWWICMEGLYPGADLDAPCSLGEVDYWALPRMERVVDGSKAWARADGRTVSASRYPQYADAFAPGQETFALPDVPAPPGMISLVCMAQTYVEPALAQLDMFVGPPKVAHDWLPADGRQLSIAANLPLYAVMGPAFGPATDTTFTFPKLAAPAAGLTYYGAVEGIFPPIG